MISPRLEFPDWHDRLRAVEALGHSQPPTPENFQALLTAVRDESFLVAGEAARSLARLGDPSVIPLLVEERQRLLASFTVTDRFVDTAERTVEPCLSMAIVWLLAPEKEDELLDQGTEFEKYMVRRKRKVVSLEEYWGPLME